MCDHEQYVFQRRRSYIGSRHIPVGERQEYDGHDQRAVKGDREDMVSLLHGDFRKDAVEGIEHSREHADKDAVHTPSHLSRLQDSADQETSGHGEECANDLPAGDPLMKQDRCENHDKHRGQTQKHGRQGYRQSVDRFCIAVVQPQHGDDTAAGKQPQVTNADLQEAAVFDQQEHRHDDRGDRRPREEDGPVVHAKGSQDADEDGDAAPEDSGDKRYECHQPLHFAVSVRSSICSCR